MKLLSRLGWFTLIVSCASIAAASEAPCEPCLQATCVADAAPPSWIFRRSTYTHDPMTGARVAQYERIAPVEPLDDVRNVTSSYRRTQTNLRGTNGSTDTYYQVQSWGNGRGGLDAEWERFHDAWKESYLQNGYYNQGPAYGPWANGNYGRGYGYPGNGNFGPPYWGPGNWGNGNWGGNGWGGGWSGGNWGPQPPWANGQGPQGGGPGGPGGPPGP
jgi:hypothetical protein